MKKVFLVILVIVLLPIIIINTNSRSVQLEKSTASFLTKKVKKQNESERLKLQTESGVVRGYITKPGELTNFNDGFFGKADEDSRYVTIILHSGSHGYFGTPGVTTKESVQFFSDSFLDRTVPTISDEGYIFLGWATEEDGDVVIPANFAHEVSVSSLGRDLYAIYTDTCSVTYFMHVGEKLVIGGDEYTYNSYSEEYTCGTKFNNYIPIKTSDSLHNFVGWYNADNKIDGDTVINQQEMTVISNWSFNADVIDDYVIQEEAYQYDFSDEAKYYKFTPSETKVYEFFVNDILYQNPDSKKTAKLAIYTLAGKQLKLEGPNVDDEIKVIGTLEKDNTYVIEFSEMSGQPIRFKYGIKEAQRENYSVVTFHANRGNDAWFDGNQAIVVKQIPYANGTVIAGNFKAGLGMREGLTFKGWATSADGEFDPDLRIVINEDIDLYADFFETNTMTLDANGGYFSGIGTTTTEYTYVKGYPFDPIAFCINDDNHVKFAGWAKEADATEPDRDIIEEFTDADSLPRTLYAVYTERITEYWDANGGYFLDNPAQTTYSSTKGIGHVFYGMALYHENGEMVPLGWLDQDDEFIAYTSGVNPYYRNKGDTVYTAVWGKKIVLDANGGYFPNFDDVSAVSAILEYDKPFSLGGYEEQLGRVAHDNVSLYLAGWATTPDAVVPNVVEGETSLDEIDHIYAVWKEDRYYIEGDETPTWNKESSEVLTFVVKRQGDDYDTYSAFQNVFVDGVRLTANLYSIRKGSLILTLKPEYLNTLSVGEHEIVIKFNGGNEIRSTFTINNKEVIPNDSINEKVTNPKTGDTILNYVIMFILSLFGIVGIGLNYLRNKVN